ncbi:recombinase family protein, partial [Bacillus thuringiensis]|nr:recombinase family protein [Bacillus thuringiensis]
TINKEEVIYALGNFNKLFKIVNDEEKKLLIRSLIREVQMEANRKDVKEITFWFLPSSVLPSNKVRRTVSQVIVKRKWEIEICY